MSARGLGAVLLVAGGLALAAAGFLPPGHPQSHWTLFGESVYGLLHPDPDIDHERGESLLIEAKLLAFAYPALAGLGFITTRLVSARRNAAGGG